MIFKLFELIAPRGIYYDELYDEKLVNLSNDHITIREGYTYITHPLMNFIVKISGEQLDYIYSNDLIGSSYKLEKGFVSRNSYGNYFTFTSDCGKKFIRVTSRNLFNVLKNNEK